MRKALQILEAQYAQQQEVEEAFPILKQKLKSKLTGLAGKFSSRMSGKNLVQKALVPYLQMFAQIMGRKNQNWNTVTWKTVTDYLTSSASLRLPMGEFEPQRLTPQELDDLFQDPEARAMIKKYVPANSANLASLLPQSGVRSVLNRAVSAPVATDKTGTTQQFLTGVMVAVIQKLFDKAEGVGDYSASQQQAQAEPQRQPQTQAQAQPQAQQQTQSQAQLQTQAQAQPQAGGLTQDQIDNLKRMLGI